MLKFTFVSKEEILLQFVIEEENDPSPKIIQGDDSWFDYSFVLFSEEKNQEVSMKSDSKEWARQLEAAYRQDKEISLFVDGIESDFNSSASDQKQQKQQTHPKSKKLKGIPWSSRKSFWILIFILGVFCLLGLGVFTTNKIFDSKQTSYPPAFSGKSLNEILNDPSLKRPEVQSNSNSKQRSNNSE